jgi:hypothetical protein
MTATNHALTGAIIGLTVSQPWLAVPFAFASHFALDALPHFEMPNNDIGSSRFRNFLLLDMLLCIMLVAILLAAGTPQWWMVAFCAFVATSPDLMWFDSFRRSQRSGKQVLPARRPAIMRLHSAVQWFAKPSGGIVEAVWLVAAVGVIVLYLK